MYALFSLLDTVLHVYFTMKSHFFIRLFLNFHTSLHMRSLKKSSYRLQYICLDLWTSLQTPAAGGIVVSFCRQLLLCNYILQAVHGTPVCVWCPDKWSAYTGMSEETSPVLQQHRGSTHQQTRVWMYIPLIQPGFWPCNDTLPWFAEVIKVWIWFKWYLPICLVKNYSSLNIT